MKFNIKELDLVRVIQTLYRHALPAGYGIPENLESNVSELTRDEVENLLMNGAETIGGSLKVISIDYVHGKPLKFEYVIDTGVTYATEYDVRNGKYRFFEALVNEFGGDQVKIIRKTYESGRTFTDPNARKAEIKEWEHAIKQNKWNNILPKN